MNVKAEECKEIYKYAVLSGLKKMKCGKQPVRERITSELLQKKRIVIVSVIVIVNLFSLCFRCMRKTDGSHWRLAENIFLLRTA